jgi:hypothetical protein
MDITRDKNIILYGLHLYFSIVKVKFGKKIFSRVFRIIFQWRNVTWDEVISLKVDRLALVIKFDYVLVHTRFMGSRKLSNINGR